MEPLGQKLKEARLARKITLEEASRVTKIRPDRIHEIEEEDFSGFASLAYAKGFLLIYGKFLEVDVTPYLDAFEISDRVTVDGYSYLQDSGPSAPPPIVRRQTTKRPALLPFLFALAVLVIGIYVIKLFLNLQRIAPPAHPADAVATVSATPFPPAPTPNETAIPRALPVEPPPASEAAAVLPTATPTPASPEPEVRRAQPVHPGDLPPASSLAPSPNVAAAGVNRIQITPVRKTFVTVTLDRDSLHPAYAGWLSPSDPPLTFQAQQITVKALERGAIEVTKNGAPLAAGDSGVTVE